MLLTHLYRLWLFIKRGLLITISYRTALALSVFSGFLGLVQLGFLSTFVSQGNAFPLISQYGGNLLTYLIIGNIFTSFIGVALDSFAQAIRSEQQIGTLEHLVLSDMPITSLMMFSAIWDFLSALLNAAILFFVAIFLFKVSLSVNIWPAFSVLLLTMLSLSGIGMMSAGIIMITKQGDPIGWAFTTLTGLLSGVIFPPEMLPRWLQLISEVLPSTHALRAMRMTLIKSADWQAIKFDLIFLMIFLMISLPTGLLIFKLGLDRTRRSGGLAEY